MDAPGKFVFIVRHGQRGDVVHPDFRNPYMNSLDASLTNLGNLQSSRTGQLIQCIAKSESITLVSSPFLGCIETAQNISPKTKVNLDWRMSDFLHILNYPVDITDSLTFRTSWFNENFFEANIEGEAPSYPEEYESMKSRVISGFNHWISTFQTDSLVIVTHLLPLEILSQVMKKDDNIRLTDNGFCCITIGKYDSNNFQCIVVADHTHAPQYIKN